MNISLLSSHPGKSVLWLVPVFVLFLGMFASCDSTPNIEGTWSGSGTNLGTSGKEDVAGVNVNSHITTDITFIPTSNNKRTGDVEFLATVVTSDAVPFDSTIVAPYEVTVTAIATAKGSYSIVDDDEIIIALDNSSITMNVDPDAVTYDSNVLTGADGAQVDSLKPQIVAIFSARLLPLVRTHLDAFQHIDDVHVSKDMMSCEINNRDFTFRRQVMPDNN